MISGEDFLVSARSRALSKRRTGLCYRARNTLTPEYKYFRKDLANGGVGNSGYLVCAA